MFSQCESEKIINHFGRPFYEKVLRDIEIYSDRWKLKILSLVDYFSINCILICRSEIFGDAVMKITNPCREVVTECSILKEYNGNRYCRVFDADVENGVILEEYIHPGTRLRDEPSLEKRLLIFTSLYQGLHIKPKDAGVYPSYTDWVKRITHYMSMRDDYKELYLYMKKAEEVCASICAVYSKNLLLHGDFHHDNILLDSDGKYVIIDPKGVTGDPVFDLPRFILNEYEDEVPQERNLTKITEIISFFEKNLKIPRGILAECFYVETVMSNCWNVESGDLPDMDKVYMAEALMQREE